MVDRLQEAEREITRYQQERERWIDYTTDLQRIIEALCNRRELPEPVSTARHHYNMAKFHLEAQSLSRTGAVKVKVKALEWDEAMHGGGVALGAAGVYRVHVEHRNGFRFYFFTNPFDHEPNEFCSEAKAKAAAQADYERRILSALEPAAPEFGSMEAYNAATKAMAARMANTAILVGDSEPSINGEHTDADGYPYAFDAPEGQQPVAYRVHAPADEHYGIGPDRLQFHPLAQYDLDNGYRQTPLYTRRAEQAVTEAMVERFIGVYETECRHRYDRNAIRAALKAAMEAGRHD